MLAARLCILSLLLLKINYSGKGQLSLICRTFSNKTLITWNITIPHRSVPETRFISSMGTDTTEYLTVGETVFQFFRTSVSPLSSIMMIDNLTTNLNGTKVNCYDLNRLVSTVFINVIGNDTTPPKPVVELNIVSEEFGNVNVTVTLEFRVENGSLHSMSINPNVDAVYDGPTSVHFIIPYNTFYNVSAVGTLCGRTSLRFLELHYIKCTPLLQILAEYNKQLLVITDYNEPVLVGTSATFSCNSSSGSNMTTCMGNGEWEPDPREFECEADCGTPLIISNNTIIISTGNSTLEGSMLKFSCGGGFLPSDAFIATCFPNGSWVPDPTTHVCKSITSSGSSSSMVDQTTLIIAAVVSSIIMIILSSALFFFIGCVCGWLGHKHKQLQSTKTKENTNQPAPVYEDLQSTTMSVNRERFFELKENIAYGPVQSM